MIVKNKQALQITAYLGIGSNLHSPEKQVDQAILNLQNHQHIHVEAVSNYYRTEAVPVGDMTEAQAKQQPEYVNAVAKIYTDLSAIDLLETLLALEAEQGRTRTYKGVPRIIDLDLLLYANAVIRQEHLIVPHPRMHERAFVLMPLHDIDASLVLPEHGAIASLLTVVDKTTVRLINPTAKLSS